MTAYAKAQVVLRDHQRDAVARLKERQVRGTPGHYLVMGTGHGKTYTALAYAMWRLITTQLGMRVRRIVWVTPPGEKLDKKGECGNPRNFQLIKSLLTEFETVLKVPVHFVNKKTPVFKDFAVNIVHHDYLRDITTELIGCVSSSFMIFDEGDALYGVSKRTSNALRAAALCPEFIIQTATPVPSKNKIERLASWLALTEEFPVTASNYLVAACNLVYLKIDLGIKAVHTVFETPQTPGSEVAFQKYRREGGHNWGKLFGAIRAETDVAFCERAEFHATRDCVVNPKGGCFVVCDNQTHVDELIVLFRRMFPTTPCGDARDIDNNAVRVVFVTAQNNRGYNGAVRFGVMLRQPYPGSPNERSQMEGRILRLTQHRTEVLYEVVYMKNTMTQLLYVRQGMDDSCNKSLEEIAIEFDRSVLEK